MRRFLTVLGVATALGVFAPPAFAQHHRGHRHAKASGPTTIHLYSESLSNALFDPTGQPITDESTAPPVGSYFSSTDTDYFGDHLRHSRRSVGWDHIVCVIATVTATGGTATCDGVISLPGGLLFADHVPFDLSDSPTSTVPITGGTGKFAGVTSGTVATTSYDPNSDDEDFVITLTYS